jgi:hypothetical protein
MSLLPGTRLSATTHRYGRLVHLPEGTGQRRLPQLLFGGWVVCAGTHRQACPAGARGGRRWRPARVGGTRARHGFDIAASAEGLSRPREQQAAHPLVCAHHSDHLPQKRREIIAQRVATATYMPPHTTHLL